MKNLRKLIKKLIDEEVERFRSFKNIAEVEPQKIQRLDNEEDFEEDTVDVVKHSNNVSIMFDPYVKQDK